jgi:putative ATPase
VHLRNAPTGLMKELGYGRDYRYAHDFDEAVVEQQHLPDNIAGHRYYEPTTRGYEQEVGSRLRRWRELLDRRRAERRRDGGAEAKED